jgi:arylsulfatase A-like enzyme
MLHVADLFPTFCGLAGADTKKGLPLDGLDAWPVIANKARTPHTEIVHSLQVIRAGDWKLIEKGASYYTWPEQPLQLYNIREDPYEKKNQAAEHPELVAKLRDRLAYYKKFGREEEPPEKIPVEPAVYGEKEEAEYGKYVREQAKKLHWLEQDEKANRKGRGAAQQDQEDDL